MTIFSELTKTNNTASSIKTEVTNKGQAVAAGDTWIQVADKITKLQVSGADYTQNITQEVVSGTVEDLFDQTLNYIRPCCFRNCQHLKKAEFKTITKICENAFRSCYRFTTLVLSGNFVRLDNKNAFDYTQLAKGGIYVKDNLVQTYKKDPVWSQLQQHIKPLSTLK